MYSISEDSYREIVVVNDRDPDYTWWLRNTTSTFVHIRMCTVYAQVSSAQQKIFMLILRYWSVIS